MPSDYSDNPFVRYLEEKTPEAFIYGLMPQRPSAGQQKFAGNITNPLFQRFQGDVARKTLAGDDLDDMMFSDWLGRNFNFDRQYRRRGMQRPARSPMRFLW